MILDKLVQIWPQPLYKVGGCVRDELLGLPIKDVDLCSSLLPSEVLSLCQTNNIKCEVINADHLVVLIDKQWEHTTFRTERNCDGVHAEEVATFWNKSFIRLSIPTQGDIANQIGSGPDVVSVWKDTVQRIYLDQQH